MAKTMGVAVCGTGWVSPEILRAFELNPHTEVRVICGGDEARARARLDEAGVKGPVRFTKRASAAIAADDVDCVSICNRPDKHAKLTIEAAKAGKHILLEKPVCLTLKDLWAMQDAVRKAQVRTVVSFVLRWNPLYDILSAQLDRKAIGNLFYGEVDYYHGIGPWYRQYEWNRLKRCGGSSLLSAGCHGVDGLRYFMRKKAVEVKGYSMRGNGPAFDVYEYDPSSVVIIKFEDGSVGKVATSLECICPYMFRISLFGTHGTIVDNKIYSKKTLPGQTDFAAVPTILPDSGDVTHHPFEGEIDHFVDCIRRRKESHVNLDDAVETHEICFAMDESARTGKPVKLPLRKPRRR